MRNRKTKQTAEFILNVTLNKGNDLQGNMEFVSTGEKVAFNGVLDMLELMQSKLGQFDMPETSTKFRSWNEETKEEK